MTIMRNFISEDQQDTIIGAIRKGLPPRAACKIARVPHGRFLQLMAEAEELAENPNVVVHELDIPSMEMLEFYFKVLESAGRAEEKWLGYMTDAGQNDWRAAHTLLKARNPQDWSETAKVQVENTTAKSQNQINLSQLSVPELEVLEKLMIKLSSNGNSSLVKTAPDRIVLVGNG